LVIVRCRTLKPTEVCAGSRVKEVSVVVFVVFMGRKMRSNARAH
jgi:hypothetical protein